MSYTNRVELKTVSFPIVAVRGSVIPPSRSVQDISTIRSGGKVQNWRKLVKQGLSASSNYSRDSYVIEKMSGGSAIGVYQTSPTSSITFGAVGFCRDDVVPTNHLTSNLSEVDSAALTLLYTKIRKETSQMNGLQFLGELREALRMIRRPAESLRKGLERYDTLLRKRKKGIPSRLPLEKKYDIWKGIISGTWLEVSFGWKPLVSDTQDIANTIARHVLNETPRTRVRAYKEDTLATTNVALTDQYGNDSLVACRSSIGMSTIGGVQYIVGMQSVRSGPVSSIDRLRSLSGLTLENFVPTLYELTPWSFLLDYFVNVGDIIEASCTNTTSVIWQQKTTRLVTRKVTDSQPYLPPGAAPVPPWELVSFNNKGGGYTSIVKSTVSRVPLAQLGIPDVVFSLPGTAFRYANIAALLTPRYHQSFRF